MNKEPGARSGFCCDNPPSNGSLKLSDYNSVFRPKFFGLTEGEKWASALAIKSIEFLVHSQAAIKTAQRANTKLNLVSPRSFICSCLISSVAEIECSL